ncbi:hypothetical protein HUW51_01450 [Adhaeribacter swui]|uniref:Uncharacterized protein n=1 Tax=Adhaeribacter swui TaxID=2086471 RepID=A0A7G7G2N0_9BACT|nr:hypothetical protein [Adhaeribacter swui]QNF31414.1 hypothetical protein HUW51_01450 [Adhaeribacter swui]
MRTSGQVLAKIENVKKLLLLLPGCNNSQLPLSVVNSGQNGYTCTLMDRDKLKRYFKRLGLAGFLFFLIKGLIWLFIFFGGWKLFSRLLDG